MGNKMKGKLSKTDKDNYTLFDEKGIPIGTTPNVLSNNTFSKLSKQNCDEIFGVMNVEIMMEECQNPHCENGTSSENGNDPILCKSCGGLGKSEIPKLDSDGCLILRKI